MTAFEILTKHHDYIQSNGEKPSEYNEDGILAAMEEYAEYVKLCNKPAVSKCDGVCGLCKGEKWIDEEIITKPCPACGGTGIKQTERRSSLIAFIQEKIKNRDMNLFMNASELVDQMLRRNL